MKEGTKIFLTAGIGVGVGSIISGFLTKNNKEKETEIEDLAEDVARIDFAVSDSKLEIEELKSNISDISEVVSSIERTIGQFTNGLEDAKKEDKDGE